MSIVSKNYTGNGSTKIFSSDFKVPSESHIEVTVDGVLVSKSDYDLINNAAVFSVAPDDGTAVVVRVGTTPDDLLTSTTNIDSVAQNLTAINTLEDNLAAVNTVATNIASVNTNTDNIADINTVAGIGASGLQGIVDNLGDITTTAGIYTQIQEVAGISNAVVDVSTYGPSFETIQNDVIPNLDDILDASDSALTALAAKNAAETAATNASTSETNASTSATNSANSASASATSASQSATSATNSANSATASATSASQSASSATASASSATASATSASQALGYRNETEVFRNEAAAYAAGVTFEALDSNGDVGTLGTQLAVGNHLHTGVYEPADATILKSADIGSTVQGYDADTTKNDVANLFTASQRGTVTTDNDLSFDLNTTNFFKCTPTATGTLTFTNIPVGQSGTIILDNTGGYVISCASITYISANDLTTINTAGIYKIGYISDGTNVYCSVSQALTSAGA